MMATVTEYEPVFSYIGIIAQEEVVDIALQITNGPLAFGENTDASDCEREMGKSEIDMGCVILKCTICNHA